MDFRDEYKKVITELSSDETAERIREGVMAKLAQSAPSYPEAPVKKPLPIKRIAIIGGSIAACLVIGFTAMIAARNPHFTENLFASDKAPNSAGMAGGAAPSASHPNSLAAEGVNGMGDDNINQAPGGEFFGGTSDGGNTGGDPTDSAPENVPPSADSSALGDSEPKNPTTEPGSNNYTEPDSETVGSPMALITFEGDGFTLTDKSSGIIYHFSPAENNDDTGTYLSPEELVDYSVVNTAEGEEYIITGDKEIVLLNDELKILGRYVIVE